MSYTVHDVYCDGPQQPGTHNTLKIVLDSVSKVKVGAHQNDNKNEHPEPAAHESDNIEHPEPAAKRPKTTKAQHIEWRRPRMMRALADVLNGAAHDRIYSSQCEAKAKRVDQDKWFQDTANTLVYRYRDDLIDSANQGPDWEPILTGTALKSLLKRLMAKWEKAQNAQCLASGTEEPQYAPHAKQLVLAMECAFSDFVVHRDNSVVCQEMKSKNSLSVERYEAAAMAATMSHPKDRLNTSTGDRETSPAHKRSSRQAAFEAQIEDMIQSRYQDDEAREARAEAREAKALAVQEQMLQLLTRLSENSKS
eukprot:m.19599 g.19599  ORF g.19599 m.19599 type:complete len:308 (+) comp10932_c0_seq3:121-1044(+)